MQIHELNNYNGDFSGAAFVAVDNGTDTGKAAIPDLLGAAMRGIEETNARIDNIIAGGDAPSEAEIIDARRGADGVNYPSLGDAIRTQIGDLRDDVYKFTGGERITGWLKDYFIATNGQTVDPDNPTASGGWKCVVLPCSEGDSFLITGTGGGSPRLWCFADSAKQVISVSDFGAVAANMELIAPTDASYLILNDNSDSESYIGTILVDRFDDLKTHFDDCFNPSKNLVNPYTMVDGYLNWYDSIAPSPSYKTTDYIPVKAGEKITFSPRIRKLALYASDKTGWNFIDGTYSNYTFTTPITGFVRVSFFTEDEWWQAEINESATPFEPYGNYLSDIVLPNSYTGNVLSLKKYVACGDSFTEGDFTGDTGVHIFSEGLYAGKNMVYPFYIGRRNYMIVNNEAKGGSTMTYIDGTNNEFSKAGGRYTQIPNDADYITLKFGINDCHAGVPIGTIDDEVNTTFYGAWNIVLRYLITNYPYAKIGMIIGNGLNNGVDFPGETYAEAERLVAQKWGIPYLDEDKDEQVPLLLRTNKDNVCAEAKTLRNLSFIVSGNNWHPNVKAHEYESTIVENFLRRL